MQRFMVAAAILVLGACAPAAASNDPFAGRNRSVLLLDEIKGSRSLGATAYDLIAQMRPEYLRNRGTVSIKNSTQATAVVYVDGTKFGDLESLRNVSAEHIFRIDYLSASDATTRYGTDHVGGAILITTKTQ
jgi:hypothetical protein